jgi:hypothetical protein
MNIDPNQPQQSPYGQPQSAYEVTPVSSTTDTQTTGSQANWWNKLPGWLQNTLVILLLLITVVGIVGSAYSSVKSFFYDPAPDTVIPYYNAIQNQDYATAFKYLAPGLKDVTSGSFITEQVFAQQAQDIDTAKGKVSSYKITNTAPGGRNNSNSDEKTYTVSVTRNGTSYDVNVYIQKQPSDIWQITGFDNI